jgi:hypothetical protein
MNSASPADRELDLARHQTQLSRISKPSRTTERSMLSAGKRTTAWGFGLKA